MNIEWPSGYGLAVLGSVDSTNNEARRRAESGELGPLWIASPHQQSGRGRDGRRWLTQSGNLAATLLRPTPPGGIRRATTLAFAAGLAITDMLEQECGIVANLKWPNDVLVDSRKIAGVLIEGMRNAVAIGIGVNLRHAPPVDGGAWKTISVLEATGRAPSFEQGLAVLAATWAKRYREWEAGFDDVRAAWLSRAAFLGQTITARLPNEECVGIFEGIDAEGALILSTSSGQRRLSSAEVFRD